MVERSKSSINEYMPPSFTSMKCVIIGESQPELLGALDFTLDKLKKRMGERADELLADVTVKIGSGLVEGGGQAVAEENLVLLDLEKMRMTLQASEDFLVQEGYFKPGERTRILPDHKDEPWSTMIYELTHELGHIVGERTGVEFDKSFSPTKYGQSSPHEAFAEAFTYWVWEFPQSSQIEKVFSEL